MVENEGVQNYKYEAIKNIENGAKWSKKKNGTQKYYFLLKNLIKNPHNCSFKINYDITPTKHIKPP